MSGVNEPELRRAFPDHVVPFKRHHVRDLDQPVEPPAHHRRHIRRASEAVEVEVCAEPVQYLDDWAGLYAGLVERHGLTGMRAFSRAAFRRQLELAGMVAVRAERDGETVGMALWLEDAPNAYYHLAAYSQAGYEVSASYALFAAAFERLRELGVRRVELGGADARRPDPLQARLGHRGADRAPVRPRARPRRVLPAGRPVGLVPRLPRPGQRMSELAILGGAPAFPEPVHVGRPNIGDRDRLMERIEGMLDRRWLTNDGPLVHEFEQAIAELLGVPHCVAMCNGTVALEIAIRAAGLSGEVIVSPFTFVATAHALQWQEITPVFCDIDPRTHNLDPARVEALITPRTTGILGVHVWGRPCAVDELARDRRASTACACCSTPPTRSGARPAGG